VVNPVPSEPIQVQGVSYPIILNLRHPIIIVPEGLWDSSLLALAHIVAASVAVGIIYYIIFIVLEVHEPDLEVGVIEPQYVVGTNHLIWLGVTQLVPLPLEVFSHLILTVRTGVLPLEPLPHTLLVESMQTWQ